MLDRDEKMQADGEPSAEAFDSQVPIGNRPAQNARRVESAVPIVQNWRGGENAADFLGLDQDLRDVPPGAHAYVPATNHAPASIDGADPSSSWLLGLDDQQAGTGLEPIAAGPGAHGARQAPSASGAADGPHERPAALEVSYSETARHRKLGGLWMPSIAALTLIGLGVALYKIYTVPEARPVPDSAALSPDLASGSTRGKTDPRPKRDDAGAQTTAQSATNEPTKPALAERPVGRPVDFGRDAATTSAGPIDRSHSDADEGVLLADEAGSAVRDTTTPLTGAPVVPTALDRAATDQLITDSTRPASERFDAWMRVYGGSSASEHDVVDEYQRTGRGLHGENLSGLLPHAAGSPFLTTSGGAAPETGLSTDASDSSVDAGGSAASRLRDGLARRDPSDRGARGAPGDRGGGAHDEDARPVMKNGIRRASKADLAGLWEGAAIPVEAISSNARLLTPAVGRVRVILKGGEIFEGRLYAIGDHKVWLDTDLGRIALLGDQVRKIDQIASASGSAILGAPGSQELAGLPRVRVRTPGGMFYGKVIARDDRTVTLITEEGAKVTLESDDVEDAPVGKTYIVRPSEVP